MQSVGGQRGCGLGRLRGTRHKAGALVIICAARYIHANHGHLSARRTGKVVDVSAVIIGHGIVIGRVGIKLFSQPGFAQALNQHSFNQRAKLRVIGYARRVRFLNQHMVPGQILEQLAAIVDRLEIQWPAGASALHFVFEFSCSNHLAAHPGNHRTPIGARLAGADCNSSCSQHGYCYPISHYPPPPAFWPSSNRSLNRKSRSRTVIALALLLLSSSSMESPVMPAPATLTMCSSGPAGTSGSIWAVISNTSTLSAGIAVSMTKSPLPTDVEQTAPSNPSQVHPPESRLSGSSSMICTRSANPGPTLITVTS